MWQKTFQFLIHIFCSILWRKSIVKNNVKISTRLQNISKAGYQEQYYWEKQEDECVCKREWRAGSTEGLGMTSTSRKHMEVNTRSPVPKPCAAINSPKTSEEGNRRQAGGWWTGKTQRLAHLHLLERCLWQQRARLKRYQTQKR